MSSEALDRLSSALEGQYRIERELGRGGMGVVYLAEDLKHGRPVALKVLRPELAEAVGKERFAREIETAARLNHPNVLALFDSGEADGVRYFVMPFVEGESLRDVIDREGPLPVGRAIEWTRQISEALTYAHGQGLVHRDIKPENILLQAGHAIVADFGIAKAVSGGSLDSLTRPGTSVGSFVYMSPEQLTDGAVIDGRADVYSLGCVLYEMLEGAPPHRADTPQAFMARKLVGRLPEHSSRPDVPDSVWSVVRKALAADADERFGTAEELASAVTNATTEVAIRRSRRRHRTERLTRGVVVLAGMVAVAAFGAWLGGRVGGPTYERLAVLPLVNEAGDPREDFYVRGIHEDLVEEMQRAGLRVLNAQATRPFDTGRPSADVADELGVDALVEGSVQRVGPRVIIELRLIDGRTAELVWSESFPGGQADILALLRRATLDLAEVSGTVLPPEAVARFREAVQVDAVLYELLLQGRYEAFQLTTESLDAADGYFRRAIDRDSTSAEAWTGLAETWGLRAQEGFITAEQARVRRDSVIAAAPMDLSDHRVLALQYTWLEWPQGRWDEAERAFLARLEEAPADQATRAYYSLFLLYHARDEEAEREATRAATLAPFDPLVHALYGQFLNARHRYAEAESVLVRARDFDGAPGFLESTLRTTYHLLGRDSLAIESTRAFYLQRDDLEALDALDTGFEAGGYERALLSVADVMVRRSEAGDEDVSFWQIGTLYTRAASPDLALEYLGRAVAEGDTNSPYLTVDPIFDPMRDDPRFQALIDQLRIPGR